MRLLPSPPRPGRLLQASHGRRIAPPAITSRLLSHTQALPAALQPTSAPHHCTCLFDSASPCFPAVSRTLAFPIVAPHSSRACCAPAAARPHTRTCTRAAGPLPPTLCASVVLPSVARQAAAPPIYTSGHADIPSCLFPQSTTLDCTSAPPPPAQCPPRPALPLPSLLYFCAPLPPDDRASDHSACAIVVLLIVPPPS